MKTALIPIVFLLFSCATWKTGMHKTLSVAHNQVRHARLQASIVCKPFVMKCIADKQNPCPALEQCFTQRKRLLLILESTEQAVRLGYEALQTSDAEGGKQVASSAIVAATKTIPDAIELLGRIKEGF